jgi:hypothetical protein
MNSNRFGTAINLSWKWVNITRVQMIWVPGHEGTEGTETADQLAKLGSEYLLIGPEPASGISAGIAKKAVKDKQQAMEAYRVEGGNFFSSCQITQCFGRSLSVNAHGQRFALVCAACQCTENVQTTSPF